MEIVIINKIIFKIRKIKILKNNINDYFIFQSIKYYYKNNEYENVYFLTNDKAYIENKDKLEAEYNNYNKINNCTLYIKNITDKNKDKCFQDLDFQERLINKLISNEITVDDIILFIQQDKLQLTDNSMNKLIEQFKNSGSFKEAGNNFYRVIKIISLCNYTKDHIKNIIIAYISNYQNYSSYFVSIATVATTFDKRLDTVDIYNLITIYGYKLSNVLQLLKDMTNEISFSQQQIEEMRKMYQTTFCSKDFLEVVNFLMILLLLSIFNLHFNGHINHLIFIINL